MSDAVTHMNTLPLEPTELKRRLDHLRAAGRRVVFTNGCFDLLHPGHVRYLAEARQLGDVLVVGVNTDASVRRLNKAPNRPINPESDRAEVLAALASVDFVTLFDDDTPLALIHLLEPDVLVKGGDWRPDQIVGADFVHARGGEVRSLPFAEGYSTTNLLDRIRDSAKPSST